MNTLAEPRFKRRRRTVDLITADELVPKPDELVLQYGMPDTITGWKALANGLLTNQSCVFHRNVEISARYAWIYKHLPTCFKWAGMAAFASHHVRARALSVPARHRSHRLRRYSAQPAPAASVADAGRGHDPRDEQRHLRRHLLGAPRVLRGRRRDRTSPWTLGRGSPLCPDPFRLRGDRRRAPRAGGRNRRPRRIDGQRKISFGRATSSSSNTSSAPWCNRTSTVCRAHSPGSSRWARSRASKCEECGRRFPTSRRSTFPRSNEGSRKFGVRTRGRG